MKHVAAYMLAALGGNANPSAADVKKILNAVGAKVDDACLDKVVSELNGKNLEELVAAGAAKLATLAVATTSTAFSLSAPNSRANRMQLHAESEDGTKSTKMTKIVCTLGPATDTPEKIAAICAKGMNVARLNFSHAGDDYTYPASLMKMIREVKGQHTALKDGSTVDMPNNLRAILLDTKGPEIRTGPLQGNADVQEFGVGSIVEVTTEDVSGDDVPSSPEGPHRLQIDYHSIDKVLDVGGTVLLDDGLLELEVTAVSGNSVTCVALNAGPIKKNKGVNLPGSELDLPALTEKDKRDLQWGCENGADFIAASFIRTGANVRSVKAYLDRCISDLPQPIDGSKAPIRPLVISKIENKEGIDNFDDILRESDGIMVARGDLGVEIPFRKVFAAQKMMVEQCNRVGKPVVVATQMLDSMQKNPRPTRAEVTDVGSAVLDGADAVMLSGETAAGKYPVESVGAMRSIIGEADAIVDGSPSLRRVDIDQALSDIVKNKEDMCLHAVARSAVESARDLGAKLIIAITSTGGVAQFISSHRPTVPVLAFCTDPQVARRLQLCRGVLPVMLQTDLDPLRPGEWMGVMRAEAMRTTVELGYARAGDRVITVDRALGKPGDVASVSFNMKMSTLSGP